MGTKLEQESAWFLFDSRLGICDPGPMILTMFPEREWIWPLPSGTSQHRKCGGSKQPVTRPDRLMSAEINFSRRLLKEILLK